MILEWLRFLVTAALLVFGLVSFAGAVVGTWRFGFIMNRMHAAGCGDTLGLLCIALAMVVHAGPGMDALKLLVLVLFLWCTSPVSSHFLIQMEYFTNPDLYQETDRVESADDRKAEREEEKLAEKPAEEKSAEKPRSRKGHGKK